MSRSRVLVGREQATTPFTTILVRLCDATPAMGAALVDLQGETVDFAGTIDPFDIKVAAAEWRLVLDVIHGSSMYSWSSARQVLVRGGRNSFVAASLDEGYAVVAQLQRHCFGISERALDEARRDLLREAGLDVSRPANGEQWMRVEVAPAPEDKRRPIALWTEGSWSPVTVLGRYREGELGAGEVGYRVRIVAGTDITLVREPLDVWYADAIV